MIHSRYLLLTLFVLLLAISTGCKKDEGQTGIVGRISATSGSSGGAIVKLMEAPDPTQESSVWSVHDAEPQLGFAYNLDATFDHRPVTAQQVDTADGDGNFHFEQVVAGDYVIVAEKQGQGWTKPKFVSTSGGEVDVGEMRLPREEVISGQFVIEENTTWEANVHYVVEDPLLVINDGVTLTIEPGAIVRLPFAGQLEVQGTLVAHGLPNNFIRFMANDYIGRRADRWEFIKFKDEATPPDLEYCAFRDASTALDLESDSGSIRNCYFNAITAEGVLPRADAPQITKCVFENVGTGVYQASNNNLEIDHSIFQTCDPFAITLKSMTNVDIYCNWFRDCGGSDTSGSGDRGVIKLDLVTASQFRNNIFETSWYAFQIGSFVDSTTRIHHNNFSRMNTVMNIGVTEEERGPSFPNLIYNCFSSIDLFVVFFNCNQHNTEDMNATRNSWGTSSEAQIEDRFIHDRDDDGTCPTVNFTPILNSCASVAAETGTAAGICQ